jgi:serine/threonine protein kinase
MRRYGKSVDWWGVGVLTYELNTGVSPFYTSNTSRMYEKILSGKYKKPKHFGKDLRDFVGRLLVVSPVYRLGNSYKGVNEIKLHPWFKSVDWISLYR